MPIQTVTASLFFKKFRKDKIMKVNFEYVRRLKAELDAINEVPFESIEWYENGQPVEMSERKIKSWLDGYNGENTDFPDQHHDHML
jgi:hypothetical protein